MDTVKTRLVTQAGATSYAYKGIIDCFSRMIREEGIGSFYNSLTPRLVSVVPMIGVQYFVYEVRLLSLLDSTRSAEASLGPYRKRPTPGL